MLSRPVEVFSSCQFIKHQFPYRQQDCVGNGRQTSSGIALLISYKACLTDISLTIAPWLQRKRRCPSIYCAQIFSGARIDHGHHKGQAVRAITDVVAMAKAVRRAVDMVDKGDHASTCCYDFKRQSLIGRWIVHDREYYR